jgi:hypothetical protein
VALPEVPELLDVPDDGAVAPLLDDAPEPLDMPEDDDVPMSLEPEDERVPVELHAASDMAHASRTIHLDINFSL